MTVINHHPVPLLTIPSRGPRLTLGAIGYGLLLLFWLSSEDRGLGPVTILGAGLSLGLGVLLVVRYLAGRTLAGRRGLLALAIWAGLVGAASAPLIASLMVFKTASHAHLYADYPLPIILGTLARLPAWSAAGALGGLGLGLLRLAQVLAHQPEA